MGWGNRFRSKCLLCLVLLRCVVPGSWCRHTSTQHRFHCIIVLVRWIEEQLLQF